jgi:two-component system, NarL family, sensor kinase
VTASARVALAALRLALVPAVLIGEQLVDHPSVHTASFPFVLTAFAAWALALLGLRLSAAAGRVRPPGTLDRVEPFVDLAAIMALTYSSGGPFSETAMALFALPVLAAARLLPRVTAGWTVLAIAGYIAVSIAHPTAGEDQATARVISQVAYLAWIGAAATLVSHVLHQRNLAVAELAEQRGWLAAHALTAEQRERRRLAELLHDESLPTLSLARQELVDYHRTGREASFDRARATIEETMAQLRGEIFDLHPYVLDYAGLAAALRAIADRCAERMGAEITVAVDPAATGRHDELIVVLARELLANAAKHSGASRVVVTVAADVERIELEVSDDGAGFAPGRPTAALLDGHIGLASTEQRARSAGGELVISSAPGQGTTVRATLPLANAAAPAP